MLHESRVGQLTKYYQDEKRQNRPLKTEILYPLAATQKGYLHPEINMTAPAPLILISHGTGGNRFNLQWLSSILVQNGYIVVAPDHYGNCSDHPIPEYFVRYWERPLDISCVLTNVLQDFSAVIDVTRIGVAGFSFGGYTALALAGAAVDFPLLVEQGKTPEGRKEFTLPEIGDLTSLIESVDKKAIVTALADKRIRAFVAMAPALGLGFASSEQVKNVTDPVLIIGAGQDQIAPVDANARTYHRLIAHSDYIELEKAHHYVFLPSVQSFDAHQVVYFKDPSGVDRKQLHQFVGKKIRNFFDEKLNHQ